MKIQRYSCDPETPGPCDHGGWVLFTDAETDKAKAVAEAVNEATEELQAERDELLVEAAAVAGTVEAEREKTKELRAELVAELARPTLLHALLHGDGCYHVRKFSNEHSQCARLVELGAWETPGSTGKFVRYRPLEHRSSGGNDDQPKTR